MQFYGTVGLNATGQKRRRGNGRQCIAGCRAGVEGSLSLDMEYLAESTFPPKNSIAIFVIAMHCCIAAIPCACVRVRCLNIQLPTYIPHPSIHPLNASGLQDSKEDPVRRSRKPTCYVPLESGHSEAPCHCLSCLRASRQDKTNKQTSSGQWSVADAPRLHLRDLICVCTFPSERSQGMA